MTSVECYEFGMRLANRAVNGGFPVPDFNKFINMGQDWYLNEICKDGLEMSIMAQKSVSPFVVETTVQVVNGVAVYAPAANMEFGPVMWASGHVNADCGGTPPAVPPRVPLKELTSAEWADRTSSRIDVIDRRNPVFMLRNATSAYVLPANIGFVTAWFLRTPRRIVVGSQIDPDGIERPLEGAANQVDPEWDNADMEKIIWRAMGYTGLQLQNDRMQATAGRDSR